MSKKRSAYLKGALIGAASLGLSLGTVSLNEAVADETSSGVEVLEPRVETVVTSAGVVLYRFQPQDYSRYDAMVARSRVTVLRFSPLVRVRCTDGRWGESCPGTW